MATLLRAVCTARVCFIWIQVLHSFSIIFFLANACRLPAGTTSTGVACGDIESGCTVAVLDAAAELACAANYGNIPAKANAACVTDGDEFTGATFCTGAEDTQPHTRLVFLGSR